MSQMPESLAAEVHCRVRGAIGSLRPLLANDLTDEAWLEIVAVVGDEVTRLITAAIAAERGAELPEHSSLPWGGTPPWWQMQDGG